MKYTIQWQQSTDGGITWSNISGQNSSSLTFTSTSNMNGYRYRALVSYCNISVPSNAAILTSLTKYTDQLAIGIIRESVIGARTNQYISVQEGIKYADTLNIINSTIVLQDGAACNNGIFSSTGSVTFTQNTLTVCPLKVEEVLCMTNIEQYFLGKTSFT